MQRVALPLSLPSFTDLCATSAIMPSRHVCDGGTIAFTARQRRLALSSVMVGVTRARKVPRSGADS
jgi:hypothetical protein